MLIDIVIPDTLEFSGINRIFKMFIKEGSHYHKGDMLFIVYNFITEKKINVMASFFEFTVIKIKINENQRPVTGGDLIATVESDITREDFLNIKNDFFIESPGLNTYEIIKIPEKIDLLSKKIEYIESKFNKINFQNKEIQNLLKEELGLSKKIKQSEDRVGQLNDSIKPLEDRVLKFEANFNEKTQRLEESIEKSRGEFEQAAKNYTSELATKAPRDYWNLKFKKHKKLAVVFGGVSGALAAGAVSLALISGPDLLGQVSLKPDNLVLWPLGLFATCGFAVVWVERILVRLMLSHLHLADDASERVVMVETYFAILSQNAETTGEAGMDLSIMLHTLFRPAATGIIKDEGVPAQFWDLANRAIGSGAKPGGGTGGGV